MGEMIPIESLVFEHKLITTWLVTRQLKCDCFCWERLNSFLHQCWLYMHRMLTAPCGMTTIANPEKFNVYEGTCCRSSSWTVWLMFICIQTLQVLGLTAVSRRSERILQHEWGEWEHSPSLGKHAHLEVSATHHRETYFQVSTNRRARALNVECVCFSFPCTTSTGCHAYTLLSCKGPSLFPCLSLSPFGLFPHLALLPSLLSLFTIH